MVNVAARLQTANKPVQVIIRPLTRKLAGGATIVSGEQELQLKGKAEPIRAHVVESMPR
ncbi:MAG: hypothetical protein WKF43_00835 [Acidimicrobiales bacterium]